MALVPSGSGRHRHGHGHGRGHGDRRDSNGDAGAIAAQFAELMIENELIAKENRLLDSFLQRHANNNPESTDTKAPKSSGGRRGTNRQIHEPTLTESDKLRLSMEEQDYRSKQMIALEEKARADVNLLKAITEGIKIRINELRKETYEFQRDIVIAGENQRTGKIMAERVIRYFEEKLKQKNALVDKMKLKNKALRSHLQKMDASFKHKEEQGDSLKPIDYHQLRIKNNQFNQKIKDCNDELLKLKQTTGKTVQELNTQKRTLNELMSASKKLKKDLKDKEAAKIKLAVELEKVENEVKREKIKNKKFKIQQSNPDMPQVMDYVNQKSSMYELEAAVHNWQRKIEIIEMAAKRARTILRQNNIPIPQQHGQHHNGNNSDSSSAPASAPSSDQRMHMSTSNQSHHSRAAAAIASSSRSKTLPRI